MKRKYRVLSNLKHNGHRYLAGDMIELGDCDATQLLVNEKIIELIENVEPIAEPVEEKAAEVKEEVVEESAKKVVKKSKKK